MSQALSEEDQQYIQRFDTPTIRDFDFPPESGNLAMPYQQNVAVVEPEISEPQTAEPDEILPPVPPPELEIPPVSQTPQSAQPEPSLTAENEDISDEQRTEDVKPVRHLDPLLIPKFVNQLVKPPVYCPVRRDDENDLYEIEISEFTQQVLPDGFPETTVWGYSGQVMDEKTHQFRYFRSAPGAVFEAIRNVPIRVKWINKLSGRNFWAADPVHHMAKLPDEATNSSSPWRGSQPDIPDARGSLPVVTQPHGGRITSRPEAWLTRDGKTGPAYYTSIHTYHNTQDAATLSYHDRTPDIAPLNTYAGLIGLYLLRSGKEFAWRRESLLPQGQHEIPIILQDRSFNTDGSLSSAGVNVKPEKPPGRVSEFFGDVITVNGMAWPNLDVERRQYRFRLFNGSGSRYYKLRMSNGMLFTQIGADNGFLRTPAEQGTLLLPPAGCADILVDFSSIPPGTKIILTNEANAPYPAGSTPDTQTTGQIMQFTVPVDAPKPVRPKKLPKYLDI